MAAKGIIMKKKIEEGLHVIMIGLIVFVFCRLDSYRPSSSSLMLIFTPHGNASKGISSVGEKTITSTRVL